MLKKSLIIATFTVASSFTTLSIAAETADTLKSAVEAASTAQKAAAAVGGEWRDIGKFLKKAAKLEKKGNFDKAVKLAKKAEEHGKLGKAQMEGQNNLEFPSYFTK
jgi:methionine aminopeptidase